MTVRLLTSADLPRLETLSDAAGWNQTEADWKLLLDIQPDGCFGFEADETIVSTATLVCYGTDLGWIGMVLTDPEYRGRGFARQVVRNTVDLADSIGVTTLKLDATDMGRPLYQSFGFRDEQPIERWRRESRAVAPQQKSSPPLVPELDKSAFGADRSNLLDRLAANSTVMVIDGGYIMTRPGARAGYIGPCVATSTDAAEHLVTSVLGGRQYWDVLPNNGHAIDLAGRLGFTPSRELMRMVRGKQLHSEDQCIYAIAGFEWG